MMSVAGSLSLLLLGITLVQADVLVHIANDTSQSITSFDDIPAEFGPSLNKNGITGYLHAVQPRNACHAVIPPPNNSSLWIALIARDNCSFVEKVRNVQQWFSAVIVYNTRGNTLEHMQGDGHSEIRIPSVFVGETDGLMLANNFCYSCKKDEKGEDELGYYVVTVNNTGYSFNAYLLWPFAAVVGTCFILMLVFMCIKWCRDLSRKRKSRLSLKHLKKIPTKKFKKGEEYDVCAICLDDYEEGEKLRLLPCSHVYHMRCIDPWLTKNKRSCPICKRKVIPGMDPDSDSDSSDEGEETSSSERTPLLRGAQRSSPSNRRSTFDNSGLPEVFRQNTAQPGSSGQPQNTSVGDSDQSDSEIGAVGGVCNVKLAKENPLICLNGPSVSSLSNGNEASSALANRDTAVASIVVDGGMDNQGYVVTGEDGESDDDDKFNFHDDVVFMEAGRAEEKKMNGVI